MKILLVTMKMDIGGAETHILELARGLSRRGVEVHVASAGGIFAEALEKEGIRHITLPLDRRALFAMQKAKKGLKALISSEHYDIVHAHARIPAFLCGMLQRKLRFRFVTTDHLDFKVTPLLKKFTDWGEFTFAVSDDLKDYLMREYGVPEERIALTVNGVDTERFSPAKREKSEALPTVLHISRLDRAVSHCALALMESLPLLHKKAKLVIVGDGENAPFLREKGRAISEALGYEAILFAGAVSDVKPYIDESDIVVAPSRAAMEGMACGKPTILSGSQGHGGIFSENITADAVRTNCCFRGNPLPTPTVLASEINALLAMSGEEREALGARCRDFILQYFSVDAMVESQLSVYEALWQRKTDGTPDILLAGYYGYGNLGDEMLLSVIIRKLRERFPTVRICVLSREPEKTARYHMVDAVGRFDLAAIERSMQKNALFLFGGGTLLQDKTSSRSLSYYLYLLHLAKKKGMKTALFAGGIGPLLRPQNAERVKAALAMLDHISLRDEASFAFCEDACKRVKPYLTFDPVVLEKTEAKNAQKCEKNAKKSDYFLVIFKKMSDKTLENLKKTVLWTVKTHTLRPLFVSLFDVEDLKLTEMLCNELGAEYRSVSDGKTLIALLRGARFVISARLHGLILATLAGTPMLACTEDEKLLSYLEILGERRGFSTEAVEKLLSEEDLIRASLLEGLPLWQEMAEEGFQALFAFYDGTLTEKEGQRNV